MAILPDVPGIEVRVKVEGELDPDYENTDAKAEVLQPPNHPTSHFYVEAKTDARYFVQINLNEHLHAYLRTKHKSATHLGVALIVDGAMACLSGTGRFVEKHRREKTCEMRHTTWKSCGVWEYRDLVFNSVLIANALDAEEIQENIGRAPRIGLIQAFVFVNPGTITSVPLFQEARRQERELRSRANRVLGLTEKSMKGLGLSHASSLHNESTTKRYRPGKYPDGEIICEFRFSYRSKGLRAGQSLEAGSWLTFSIETLHSLGIIPRPGSKMPNFSGMTREELLSLAERNWRTLGDEEDRKPLAHSNRAVKTEPRGSTPGQDPLQLTAVRKRKRVEVDLTED